MLFMQIGKPFVVAKLKDYPQFQSVALAIEKSGFKVCPENQYFFFYG